MTDPIDEDADIRSHLAALGPAALAELCQSLLSAPSSDSTTQRAELYRTLEVSPDLRALAARPVYADLATLIAMADTDEVVRLRLLRAIRDLGVVR